MANLRDTMVFGSLRATDTLYSTTAQFQILKAPTVSEGTSYAVGSNGQTLISNGTSIYWGTLGIEGGGTGATNSSGARTNLGLGAASTKGVTDNSAATAVTSSDTNLITARTLYYAGYLPLSGGDLTGEVTNTKTIIAASGSGIYTNGGSTFYFLKANTNTATNRLGAIILNSKTVNGLACTDKMYFRHYSYDSSGNITTGFDQYYLPAVGSGQITSANYKIITTKNLSDITSVGTITTGTWNGTVINSDYIGSHNHDQLIGSINIKKGTNPSDRVYTPYSFTYDNQGTNYAHRINGFGGSVSSSGETIFQIMAYAYTTSTSSSTATASNSLTVKIAADGTCSYSVTSAPAFRTAIGLGSIATKSESDYVLSSAIIDITHGGTNSNTAVGARTNLGLDTLVTYYAVCNTGASTQRKNITIDNFPALTAGLKIRVKFANAQTYNGVATLCINGDTDNVKNIRSYGTTNSARYAWGAGSVIDLTYDGEGWVMDDRYLATTTYYGVTKLYTGASSTSSALALTPKSLYDSLNGITESHFSSTASYAIGDTVRYENNLYKCSTEITTGGEAWSAEHWTVLPTLQKQINPIAQAIKVNSDGYLIQSIRLIQPTGPAHFRLSTDETGVDLEITNATPYKTVNGAGVYQTTGDGIHGIWSWNYLASGATSATWNPKFMIYRNNVGDIYLNGGIDAKMGYYSQSAKLGADAGTDITITISPALSDANYFVFTQPITGNLTIGIRTTDKTSTSFKAHVRNVTNAEATCAFYWMIIKIPSTPT